MGSYRGSYATPSGAPEEGSIVVSTPLLEIERLLADTAARIENGQQVVAKCDEEHTTALREYELAMARALLRASGPNAESRKAEAVLATVEERNTLDVAGLKLRNAQGRLRALRDKGDLYRSIGSSVRASLTL